MDLYSVSPPTQVTYIPYAEVTPQIQPTRPHCTHNGWTGLRRIARRLEGREAGAGDGALNVKASWCWSQQSTQHIRLFSYQDPLTGGHWGGLQKLMTNYLLYISDLWLWLI